MEQRLVTRRAADRHDRDQGGQIAFRQNDPVSGPA